MLLGAKSAAVDWLVVAPPPPPQPAKARVATPAAARSFVRCFMSVFLR